MARITLEPIKRFAFLVLGIHILLGAVLWWWLHTASAEVQGSDGQQQSVWMAPSDFTMAAETPPEQPAPKSQEPAPLPPPAAATVASATNPPPAKPEPEEDNLPKAIAIDPAQAASLMARAQVPAPPAVEPKPVAPAPAVPAVPVPPPVVKPDPKPVVAEAPKTAAKHEPAPPAAPAATEGSRFVTVSHPTAKPPPKDLPKVANLLDMAALDAATTGATGAASGIRLDEVDKAIIAAFLREWLAPDATKLSFDQRTVSLDVIVDREGRVVNFVMPKKSGSDDLDLSVLEAADRLGKIETKLPASYPADRYEFQVNFHVE